MNEEEYNQVMDALKKAQQTVAMAYWRQRCVEAEKSPKCEWCGEEADHPRCKEAVNALDSKRL